MDYILLTGPQEGPNSFDGDFESQDSATVTIQQCEDRGTFCWLYYRDTDNNLHLEYSTED